MSLDELREKRAKLKQNTEITVGNMQKIVDESNRVVDVAHNSREILDNLDAEFEKATGLQGNDVKFLFTAIGLQVLRIVLVNALTEVEKAGSGNKKEDALHSFQEKLLGKFKAGDDKAERLYYASMEHIITRPGVPYDATSSVTQKQIDRFKNKGNTWDFDIESMIPSKNEKIDFSGANHRFTTLAHDPIIGLVVGTSNIMTNTLTSVDHPLQDLIENTSLPDFGNIINMMTPTHHVIFTSDYKNPMIGPRGSTIIMFEEAIRRTIDQPEAFVASLIKQIIHIGTDLYTPCGIQLPAANLILSKANTEKLTQYINTGDLIKIGASAKVAEFINTIISTVHMLMYDPQGKYDRDIYNVRTRKIIMYSNLIATGSNVLWIGGNMLAGNEAAIEQLDIGGLIVMMKRLVTDTEYIRQIKNEFVFGNFKNMIQGEDLGLETPMWD